LKPEGSPTEVFTRVLDATIALLDPERATALGVPDDDLHREILLPLLPAMLGDRVIRQYWRDQSTAGFMARLNTHLLGEAERPEWMPADFEIHVAASYSAGPDAKALADTLLSEESLRHLTAALMNQLSESAWAQLPRVKAEAEEIPAPEEVDRLLTEPAPEIAGEKEPVEPIGPAKLHEEAAIPTPMPAAPALRPVPWSPRRNPIRCGSSLGFSFPNWLAVNPLKPWKTDAGI
jgi:hypothetical protein